MGHGFHWLIEVSEIQPGQSCILGQNYAMFYIIHCTAISLITASLISCSAVIISIIQNHRRNANIAEQDLPSATSQVPTPTPTHTDKSNSIGSRHKRGRRRTDFVDRFPFYLAIADGLWGLSHLIDHFVLLVGQTCPEKTWASLLSINMWFFMGYQQLMHAGLAVYTYLKVVKGTNLNLGEWEWKLHLLAFALMASSIAVFYPLGSFGSSGYWVLQDVQSTGGKIMGFYICFSTATQALCTTLCYKSIKKVVESQREIMIRHGQMNNSLMKMKKGQNSTATECLTTFVRIAFLLYCPLAVLSFTALVITLTGFIEPLGALLIVIVANSSGWANTFGYFHNKRVKDRRRKVRKESNIISSNLLALPTANYNFTRVNTTDNARYE